FDLLVGIAAEAYRHMWRPGHAGAGPDGWPQGFNVGRAYHGERTWVSDLGDFGDAHLSDTPRSFRTFAEIAWALQLNRDSNPEFAAWADEWRAVFEGYERVWSAAGDGRYPPDAKV